MPTQLPTPGPPSPASSLTSVSSFSSAEHTKSNESPFLPKPKGGVVQATVKVIPSYRHKEPRPTPIVVTEQPESKPKNHSAKKRKTLGDESNMAPQSRQLKRLRTPSEPISRTSSRSSSRAPSPPPLYRGSRSRSTSAFLHDFPEVGNHERNWCYGEACAENDLAGSSENAIKDLVKKYKTYFKNLNDPEDKSFDLTFDDEGQAKYPVVELEYPNRNASERFALLQPKDPDHYNPIMCLESTLYIIIEHFLTPKQIELFGTIPNPLLTDASSPPSSPPPTSSPVRPRIASSISWKETAEIPPETVDEDEYLERCSLYPAKPGTNYLRSLQRAINLQDGPLFLKSMRVINFLLQRLKYPRLSPEVFSAPLITPFQQSVMGWTSEMPEPVLMRIIEENYQRTVGPHVAALRQYQAFSSTVYGELMPSLTHEIIKRTGLTEDKLFLDLGSGVGNVVIQASLQTGCRSFGIEIMPTPAKVARESVENMKKRCRMWGINIGDVELEEGDMLASKKVAELMSQADVVLVDNKVFDQALNEALRPKFLDLKEGAYVVSLVPFVSSINARMTERNLDDISAIFHVTEHAFHSGSVSWGSGGGTYYIHRVDRAGYADMHTRFEASRRGSTRSTRSRR